MPSAGGSMWPPPSLLPPVWLLMAASARLDARSTRLKGGGLGPVLLLLRRLSLQR